MFRSLLLLSGVLGLHAAVREYNFTLGTRIVMQYSIDCLDPVFQKHCSGGDFFTYERNGVLFYHNASSNSGDAGIEFPVPPEHYEHILVIDGFSRVITTVNGQVPGPTIEVDEGDEVVVHMQNNLHNEATTLHWHGMYQHGTPWMDGVSQITQCAVLPGQSFTYRFFAEPAGTHFWHAHHGVQRPEGLFGPLIVHPKGTMAAKLLKNNGNADVEEQKNGVEVEVEHSKCDGGDTPLVLSVWQHENSESVYTQRDGFGFFPNGPKAAPWKWTRDVSGKLVGEVPLASVLMNGLGRFGGNTANLTVLDTTPGATRCFRVIASQEGKALRVSVDQHVVTVTASDGSAVKPMELESVIIFPGETYDISVTASPGVKVDNTNFWVRAETLETAYHNHTGLAILRYTGAPDADPTSTMFPENREQCTAEEPCRVLNCPFPSYPPEFHTECVAVSSLVNDDPTDVVPEATQGDMFLNFVFEPSVNNYAYVAPDAPPLTQPDTALLVPCPEDCTTDAYPHKPCYCTHVRDIPFNATVQLVLTNLGIGGFGVHPVHLHGHTFQVLRVGYPPVYNDTGTVCKWPKGDSHPTCLSNDDIECAEGTGCAVAKWKDGKVPPLNLDSPPRKDTVVVPPGGYTVIRFVADNPGWWGLHCHMAHHLQSGMAMFLRVGDRDLLDKFAPPAGFPTCGSFVDSTKVANEVEDSRARWEALLY